MTLFISEAEVREIGEGVIARTLPKPRWTHAAHFAAAVYLIRHASILPERDMPGLIRAYNEATGVANTDHGGYHETITQVSIRAARAFLVERDGEPLHAAVNALMASPLGEKDWLLTYWSKVALFSVAARRGWVEPDVQPLPF